MNNDSSQQALNCSLNPNPSGRRITVITLPCMKQNFLQNYRYSKNFSCFSLQKSILPPLCARAQGSDRKPIPALEVLPACTPRSHRVPLHHLLVQIPTSRNQDKIIFTLKGKPNDYLPGKKGNFGCLTCTLLVPCTPMSMENRRQLFSLSW